MSKPCSRQLDCALKTESYDLLFASTIYQTRYEFRRCRECQLIYHHPGSSASELQEHYTNYGRYSDRSYFAEEIENRRPAHPRLADRLSRYVRSEQPRTLEVGCSNGVMLKHFSDRGYDCFGMEVDPASSELARELIGEERVFTGFLSDSPFLDGSFDLVLCVQTIEHVPDPFELLQDMNRALKKGGILYIETPNFGGPSFRLLKDRWKNTAPGDHISMFSAQALERFLRAAEFEIVSKKVGGFAYNARRGSGGEYERYKGKAMGRLMTLAGYGLRVLNRGDNTAFVCRK